MSSSIKMGKSKEKPTSINLFCGVGGLTAEFKNAGYQILGTATMVLSSVWMIRRVVFEFIPRDSACIECDLPLHQPGNMLYDKREKEKTK